MVIDYLKQYLSEYGIPLNEEQLSKLERYAFLLKEWNEKINLTAITDDEGIATKHFLDSIALLKNTEFPIGAKVADVGTGAGFPGIVLKIARPDLKISLIDSLQKRITFLDTVCRELGLDIKTYHLRAEDAGHEKDLRETFDVVTARAVASLPALCEYCLPLCKVGGFFVPMKTADIEKEISESENAIKLLGGKAGIPRIYELPVAGSRGIVKIQKVIPTPEKYPRQRIKITAKPL